MRGTEGRRSVRWVSHWAGKGLLPSTANIPAFISRLFGFDLSQTPIPDHFCSIPVTKNRGAEWKLLDRGGKMKIIYRVNNKSNR